MVESQFIPLNIALNHIFVIFALVSFMVAFTGTRFNRTKVFFSM